MRIKVGDDFLDMNNSVIAQTYAVNEIGNLKTRQGGFSNDFTIPLTARNQGILGFPGDINSTSRNPYTKVAATLFDNGSPVAFGSLKFQIFNDTTLQCSFFADNSDWFSLIKDKKLTDLNLSDFDHTWQRTTIATSISDAKTSGYTYPIIQYETDYLVDTSPFQMESEDMFPAMFVITLLRQILFDVGWKADGELLEHPLFARMIVPFSGKSFAHTPAFVDTNSFTEDKDITQVIPVTDTDITWDNIDVTVPVTTNGIYTVTVFLVITGSIVGSDSIDFQINTVTNTTLTGITAAGSYRWVVSGLTLDDLDEITTAYVIAGGSTPTVTDGSFLQIEVSAEMTLGSTVQMANIMPDIKQSDFIRYIAFIFGGVLQANSFSKTVTFSFFKSIKANLDSAVDWSNKLDISKTKEVDFTKLLNNYKSVSIMNYLEDENDSELVAYLGETGKNLGQGQFDIDNEHIQGTETIYEAPFTPMININSFTNQIYIPQISYKEAGVIVNEPVPKIAILSTNFLVTDLTIDLFSSFNILGGGTSILLSIPFCWFVKTQNVPVVDALLDSLAFDQVDFPNVVGEPMKDRFLKDQEQILNSMKYLKAFFHLTEIDISELDFIIPVYIEHYKAYFYRSQILNFEGSKDVTEAELVKISGTAAAIPTSDWILATGLWDDSGIWVDGDVWID